MSKMTDLIRKRHAGPAWVVIPELANSTGARAKRRADAVAIGLWPSRGYEIHGYEIKLSREDLKRELEDPGKADAVGKFCDYWWLVVNKEDLLRGLLVPETWGIMAPRKQVLDVVRKAPKRDASAVDRGFMAAVIRSVTEQWVPRSEFQALQESQWKTQQQALAEQREQAYDESNRRLQALEERVRSFEAASGVNIADSWAGALRNIGEAVRLINECGGTHSAMITVQERIRRIQRSAEEFEHISKREAETAARLQADLDSYMSVLSTAACSTLSLPSSDGSAPIETPPLCSEQRPPI